MAIGNVGATNPRGTQGQRKKVRVERRGKVWRKRQKGDKDGNSEIWGRGPLKKADGK